VLDLPDWQARSRSLARLGMCVHEKAATLRAFGAGICVGGRAGVLHAIGAYDDVAR
jgi:hypothetical protein